MFFLLLPIPVAVILMGEAGWLRRLENVAMDYRFRWRGEIESPVKLIYVNVDSLTVSDPMFGERPFPRSHYARAVHTLFNAGKCKAVGIDIVFTAAAQSILVDANMVEQDNGIFRYVIENSPNLVLAAAYTQRKKELDDESRQLSHFPFIYAGANDPSKNDMPERPGPELMGYSGGNIGIINVDERMSGGAIPRWVPMFAETPLPVFYHIGLELARLYYDLPPEAIKRDKEMIRLVNRENETLITVPLTREQMIEVNYFSAWDSPLNPQYSLISILGYMEILENGAPEDQREAQDFFANFEDAIVMIGPTDPLLQDLAASPFDDRPVPKVGVHGNLLKQLFANKHIQRPPPWLTPLVVLLLTGAVSSLGVYSGRMSALAKFISGSLLVGYILSVFDTFSTHHIVLPLVAPVIATLLTTFVGMTYQLLMEEKKKGRIKGMFAMYVSPALVDQMVEAGGEPELGGHEEYITAFFSDVQGFSGFSELLTADRLVDLMNEYLTALTDLLKEEGGTLDKYIGDAIVAMFGAPVPMEDHALRACVATQRMQLQQIELRKKWASEGDKWPVIVHEMQTRMGLNTGNSVVGNMGSEGTFNFTMMGDTVNLGARCESGAKAYGAYTMITEDTRNEAEKFGDRCIFRFMDKIVVKGRTQPVGVHEIMCLKENATTELLDCAEVYSNAISKYLAQDWDGAITMFEKASLIEPNQPGKTVGVATNPSLVLLDRCKVMKADPPAADWDGVYVMKTK